MRQTIFECDKLLVLKVPGTREDVVFVTFEALLPERAPGRAGFGESFFETRGFTAYHLQPTANDWYHFPEMEPALAQVRADIPEGTRVVTYGMSMGAYGAYRFSEPLRADAVIAFSPQYSVHPWRAWWERRWRCEGKSFLWDRKKPYAPAAKYVFYDPLNADRRHINRMSREASLKLVRICFGGHATIALLQECGLLERVILDIAKGELDIAALEAMAWEARIASPTYQRTRQRKRTGLFRRMRYVAIEYFVNRRYASIRNPTVDSQPSEVGTSPTHGLT